MNERSSDKPEIRDTCVKAYFTPQDAETLAEIGRKVGLSRSALIVAVMERLIIGGFSPVVGAKVAFQLQKRARDRGFDAAPGFYFGIRPLPPLPAEDLTEKEKKQVLETLENAKTC